MTGRSSEFVAKSLELAREMLDDAEFMLEKGSLRTAADRACCGMFHAVHAALAHEGVDRPKTHAGLINLFGRELIQPGTLPSDLGQSLSDAFRLRQESDYDVTAVISADLVRRTVTRAESFLGAGEDHVEVATE